MFAEHHSLKDTLMLAEQNCVREPQGDDMQTWLGNQAVLKAGSAFRALLSVSDIHSKVEGNT